MRRIFIWLDRPGANVATGHKDVIVITQLTESNSATESGLICVVACFRLSSPGMVRPGNQPAIRVTQFAMSSVDQSAEASGIDEQGLTPSVAQFRTAARWRTALVLRHEPQACWDGSSVEELTRQHDDAVDEVGLDDGCAYLSFARLH